MLHAQREARLLSRAPEPLSQQVRSLEEAFAELTAASAILCQHIQAHVRSEPQRLIASTLESEGGSHVKLAIVVAVIILLQRCATVHHGRHQEISVVTDPAGANVEIRCGKLQEAAVTPTTVRLPRRVEQCSLVVTRAGFQPETVVFDSSPSGWVWGNFAAPAVAGTIGTTRQSYQAFFDFLLGALIGGIGFGIDALSGAMWQLEPDKVELRLMPK